MTKYFTCGVILLIGLQLAGCYTDFGPVVVEPERIAATSLATATLRRFAAFRVARIFGISTFVRP